MDIEELASEMNKIKRTQNAIIEDKVVNHMKKVTKSINSLEIWLFFCLAIPSAAGMLGFAMTSGMESAFYLAISVIGLVGIIILILLKHILVELIYIELATRGHGRDDE